MLIESLIDDDVFTLDEAIDSGLYKKSIKLENSGTIFYASDMLQPFIERDYEGNKYVDWKYFEREEDRKVTSLKVTGEDLKEY